MVTEGAFARPDGDSAISLLEALDAALGAAGAGNQTELVGLRQSLSLTRYTSRRIHQNVEDTGSRVWVRSWTSGGAGWAGTSDVTPSGLRDAIARAEANADLVGGDRLDLPSDVAEGGGAAFFPSTAGTDAGRRAALAADHIEQAGAVEVNANLRVALQDFAVVNSVGLRAATPLSYVALSVVAREPGGATWYETAIGRDVDALDLTGAVNAAARGAAGAADPVDIEPGDYRVLLDPPAVSMLLATLGYVGLNALGAGAVRDGSSFLAHHEGARVGSNLLTLRDDPTDPKALFTPFDAEGTPRHSLDIIKDGIAVGPAHDLSSARAAGTASTGHALPVAMKTPSPLSLSIAPGDASYDELVAALGDGLIVHRIHPFISLRGGPNANLSGTSRDGVLVVRNGGIVGSAKNVRWSEDMTALFASIEAVSADRSMQWMDLPDHAPITNHVPSLLCGKLTVHGSQPRV